LLGVIVVLAVLHYATLLGVRPAAGGVGAGQYAAVAVAGLGWGWCFKSRRPQVYATIGWAPRRYWQRAPLGPGMLP